MPPASETRNLREEIPEDLEQLSRVKLQALAKTHGIKANKKNVDIIAELLAHAEEQPRPDQPGRAEQHRPEGTERHRKPKRAARAPKREQEGKELGATQDGIDTGADTGT